jgi:hypothetical protein
VSATELGEIFAAEQRFVADVETDHGERPSGLEYDLCGFRIVEDVGFGGGVDVAALDGAAHEDDFFDERNDARIFFDGESDVGERADGDEGDLVWRGVH